MLILSQKLEKELFRETFFFLVFILLISSCGKEYKANELFSEAVKMANSAQAARDTSYLEAYNGYKQALLEIQTIILKYPKTELAGKIQRNEIPIGQLTFKDLEKVVSLFQKKAEGEKDPFSCALYLVNQVDNPGFKDLFLYQTARYKAEGGEKDEAFRLIGQIDEDKREGYLEDLAGYYVEAGKYELAQETVEKIGRNDIKAGILNRIALAYLGSGQTEPALKVLSYAYSTSLLENDILKRVSLLKEIAPSFARVDQKQQALDILEMVKKICLNYQKSDRGVCLQGMVTSYANSGFFAQMMDIVTLTEDTTFKDLALSQVLRECLKAKRLDLAYKYLGMNDKEGKANWLSQIATYLAQSGDFTGSLKVVKKIRKLSLPDPRKKDRIIFSTQLGIAIQYAEHGKIGKALELIKSIPADYYVTNTLMQIAFVAAKNDELDKAREIIATLRYRSEQDQTWLQVASVLAKKGNFEQAIQIIGQTGECYKENGAQLGNCQRENSRNRLGSNPILNSYLKQKSEIISEICLLLLKSNQIEKAYSLAMQIPGASSQYPVLVEVARSYARNGNYLKALNLVKNNGARDFSIPALSAIAVEYARSGNKPDPEMRAILHSLVR